MVQGPNDDHDPPGRPWPGRRLVLALVGLALALAVVGVGVAVALYGDDGPDVEVDLPLAGPGTDLAWGLEVVPGSSLLGPVVVTEEDRGGEPAVWLAVVTVDSDDPLAVWSGYIAQLEGGYPESGVDPGARGCRPYDDEHGPREALCDVEVGGVWASMASTSGDVTGRFHVRLRGDRSYPTIGRVDAPSWPGGPPPAPEPARARPEVGEPLAPETTSYPGDDDRFVLIEGSELLVQYGSGTVTGGFDVMLRITPGADLATVADAYAEQATEFEGAVPSPPEVVEHDGTTVTIHRPPGGAGGYEGTVMAVDRPSGDDYIAYELHND